MNTGNQMLARFAGLCTCGGTIAPDDLIAYDRGAKKVVGCRGCGLQMNTGMKWSLKGVWTDTSRITARDRANALVAARASLARCEASLAAASTPAMAERRARYLVGRREDLALAEADAAGRKGERSWQRPTPRDIELAEVNRLRAEAIAAAERALEDGSVD